MTERKKKGCPIIACRWCGDMLIHQHFRGAHESSSAWGQWLHRRITDKTSFVDVDMQVTSHYLADQIHRLHFTTHDAQRLTILEHKKPGDKLSEAQSNIVLVWRRLIALGIKDGHISRESGLFIVECEPPWTTFDVTSLAEDVDGTPHTEKFRKSEREMVDFVGGPRYGTIFWGRA
jgi:hypothetical protein